MKPTLTDHRASLLPLAGKQVVVADPNPASRTVLRDTSYALGAAGVAYCASANDVLRAVGGREVHVILCEFRLDEHRDGQHLLEELRTKRLIPLSTVFMVITAERHFKQVVAVAEFAPDDYLVKPFTQEQLRTRLLRANAKKQALARAYALIESGASDLAVHECRRVAATRPRFFADACRLGVEVLRTLERYEEAEALLARLLALKPLPWALMALAAIHHETGRHGQAEEVLHGLIASSEALLPAYDLLATVKEALGKDEEALAVLETAGAISSSNVVRLRRTGAAAQRVGRYDRAEAAFTRVVERVRDSSLLEGADFANLSGVLVAQGKSAQAQAIAAEQRKLMRGHPELEFVGKLIEYQHARRAQDAATAGCALDRLVELLEAAPATIAPPLQLQVLEACFDSGRAEQGCAIVERIAAAPGIEPRLLQRAQTRLDAHRRAPAPIKPLDVDGILASLDRLGRHGWDAEIAARVYDALVRGMRAAGEGSDAHAKLAAMLGRYEALKANYGIVPDPIGH